MYYCAEQLPGSVVLLKMSDFLELPGLRPTKFQTENGGRVADAAIKTGNIHNKMQ